MPLMDKQRREIDTRRPSYATFRKRRRIGLLVFVLLAALLVVGIGSYFLSGTPTEEVSEAPPPEEVETPAEEEAAQEESAAEKKAAEERAAAEEEERKAAVVPDDPTLFLTVPRLGIYGHTVRNEDTEAALDLGAIKVPKSGFPWEKEDTNTYIACHRIGWPGTESYNQCLNLPAMQMGDEIFLQDTLGRVYQYRISDLRAVSPNDSWITKPVAGKDVISLQTCTETLEDWWTLGPGLFGGGPESGRFVAQAERV
jgi:sortase A